MNHQYNLNIRWFWLILANFIFIQTMVSAQDTARFIGLGLPNASAAWDVSDDGLVVVGSSGGAGFIWTEKGGFTALPIFPSSTVNEAVGVSRDGTVIAGTGYGVPNVTSKALCWTGGAVSALAPPPHSTPASEQSHVFDISSDGTKIVGFGTSDIGDFEAVLWSGGGVQHLGILSGSKTSRALAISPDGTVIVGDCVNMDPIYSVAFKSVGGGSLQSLGTGGYFASSARGASYNGEVIVGFIQAMQNGLGTAAKWTSTAGWELLQGITGDSYANGVSANGDIIVGKMGGKAFIWDKNNGARDFKSVLENEFHLDLTGWTLTDATAVDSSGNIIVGYGTHNGMSEAWYAKLPQLKITKPTINMKWIAGEKDTIKWSGGKKNQMLSISYRIDPNPIYTLIDFVASGDTGFFVWDIPINILSKKCMIKIMDFNDPSILDTSDIFKIKPYILTRDSSGQYEPYRTAEDQWGFWNDETNMFPQTWYQQFDYQGIDPFTNLQYSQWQGGFVFASSISAEYPDWISWVNTFGINACYRSTTLGLYSPKALAWWDAVNSSWIGSCFGISASNVLAFSYKSLFQSNYSSFPGFANPITVLSNDGVKTVVNELFTHQFGNPYQQLVKVKWNVVTPNQTLNELKAMLREDNVAPRTLSIGNNNGPGAHSILPYKLQQDFVSKHIYYLFVYDNSYPNHLAIIKIDTTANSNNGNWTSLYGWANWGGSKKFMLGTESIDYFNNATLPKEARYDSPFVLSSDELDIYTNIDANTKIIDALGNITGFSNGSILSEIPNSVPLSYLDGSETPPYGYSLPTNNYSVFVDNFTSDTVKTFFFTGNKSFFYKRIDAEQNQTDRFFFDGGVSVTNPDQQSKTVSLLNIINETTQEKLFSFSSLELAQNDSVKIENPDSNKIKLVSYGTAKDYDIEINYVDDSGIGRFGEFNIPLTSNSSHTITPNWNDVTNTELKIIVDEGNDGTVEDTLSLTNKLTGIGDDHGSLIPTEFRLEQNYPNPFNPSTKISWQSPVGSHQTLRIYDILGNEVAILVDEYKPAGRYEVQFDASKYSSGIYFYQLKARNFIGTKKMVLLR